MRIIDLSVPLQKVVHDSEPKISYVSHKKGGNLLGLLSVLDNNPIKLLGNLFGYLLGTRRISHKSFPGGHGLAWENFKGDTHTGTHLDAPYHFGPVIQGKPAKTIDETPLDWCFRPGIVIDVSDIDGSVVGKKHIVRKLKQMSVEIQPLDIILFYTGGGIHWNTHDYLQAHKSIHPEVIEFLAEHQIKILGVDGSTIDPPFRKMFDAYLKTKDKQKLWPAHIIGRKVEYLHLENVCNLEQLLHDPTGYYISCFPIKIKKGSAGWVRLVAISKEHLHVSCEEHI